MLRIMIKVSAYILSVHSSSGFYEELHQVVVTLPSRQVKRLKLGDQRFARDFFQIQEVLTWSSDGPFPALSCSWARHCLKKGEEGFLDYDEHESGAIYNKNKVLLQLLQC